MFGANTLLVWCSRGFRLSVLVGLVASTANCPNTTFYKRTFMTTAYSLHQKEIERKKYVIYYILLLLARLLVGPKPDRLLRPCSSQFKLIRQRDGELKCRSPFTERGILKGHTTWTLFSWQLTPSEWRSLRKCTPHSIVEDAGQATTRATSRATLRMPRWTSYRQRKLRWSTSIRRPECDHLGLRSDAQPVSSVNRAPVSSTKYAAIRLVWRMQ